MNEIVCERCKSAIGWRRDDGTVLIHHQGLEFRLKIGRGTRRCTAWTRKSVDDRGRETWGPCGHINVVEVVRAAVGAA